MTNAQHTHTPSYETAIPAYDKPVWVDGKVTNKGDLPLWGGKGPVPKVGTYVDIAGPRNEVATVLGYIVDSGWLMLWCERHSDRKQGDLAGTEIRWTETRHD